MNEAEMCFEYMLEHDMTPHDDHIDHFRIYHANLDLVPYFDEFQTACGADVERKIIPWIREEQRSGRLKDRSLWRPFRDAVYERQSIMGYRHLFIYHPTNTPIRDPHAHRASFGPEEIPCSDGRIPHLLRVYFMLSLIYGCCHYPNECDACTKDESCIPTYVASLYGWEEDDTHYLKPYFHFGAFEAAGSEVPTEFWNRSGDDSVFY